MAMTHYLRSRYDAILIGVGTAVADDPTLNCEIEGVGGYGGEGLDGQPRPIIIDPRARWDFTENHQLFKLAKEGKGRAPFIITGPVTPPAAQKAIMDSCAGKFISLELKVTVGGSLKWLDWKDILDALSAEGLKSVMIEGGADVINSLLVPRYFSVISSVIVTIAPTWLGQGGVVVSPGRRLDDDGKPTAAARLDQVAWKQFGEDIVLCGKVKM
jgi:2,5-diamino-6-(ribosylamino)-4(3H)-pyrimidinone 5'-phosphate reductase